MLESFGPALVLGFAAGVMPGPLQTFLLLQTFRNGPRAGLHVLPAPLISDGPIIAVCLLVLNQAGEVVLRALAFCGGLFLLYLVLETWRGLHRDEAAADGRQEAATEAPRGWKVLARAALINGLGPGPWLFWGTVMGPMLIEHWRLSAARGLAFLGTFYGTLIGLLGVQLLLFAYARRRGPRIARAGTWLGMGLLAVFATLLALYGAGVIDRYSL
ncbi:MAG: LysE family transporter [Thermoanaerobaculia bacterium]